MHRYLLAAVAAAALIPASVEARAAGYLVPASADQVTSIKVRVQAMPIICAAMTCPTPTHQQRTLRPRTTTLKSRGWFSRLTNDVNRLPKWQMPAYANGCSWGPNARLYTIAFRYEGGDQWTITVDRGPFAEMVFPNNGNPDYGFRATCITPRTASRLNHDLDQALK